MRRENNFDILRLLLAWIVVITHCKDLSRAAPLYVFEPMMQSGRAVEAFFAISGCLIVASWDRTRSAGEYFRRRARRILPAYWLAIAGCLVLGSFMTTLSRAAFWKSAVTWKYVLWNTVLLSYRQPSLPGVFTRNPGTAAMDGALWTIKLEVMFYLFVPLLVWCIRKLGKAPTLSVIFVVSIAYRMALQRMGRNDLAFQLPGQLCFFVVGSAVYYYFAAFLRNAKAVWVASFVLLAASLATGWIVLDAVAVPLLTMAIAFLLPPYRGITRFGDFSYGTYVLHFPIVQTIVALGLFARAPFSAVLIVAGITSLAAVLSWFLVERTFLETGRVRQQESLGKGEQAV